MDASAAASAYAAIQRAQALAARAGEKERALIAALAKRYAPSAGADRRALDAAYADAMAEAARRFPDDPHVAVPFADAVMNLSLTFISCWCRPRWRGTGRP